MQKNQLANILRKLQAVNFLKVNFKQLEINNSSDVEFLQNAHLYSQAFQQQWYSTQDASLSTHIRNQTKDLEAQPSADHVSFIYSRHFLDHITYLRSQIKPHLPAIIKSQCQYNLDDSTDKTLHFMESEIKLNIRTATRTHLISDYYFDASNGLEKFYNIQRERKITWMRFAANPSRFFIVPNQLSQNDEVGNSNLGCQSIKIQSQFDFGACDVEHITLVPLHQQKLKQVQNYYLENNGCNELPSVIRSVIDLEQAACVLLLDGFAQKRDHVLFLNRKLAPYQCAVTCFHKDIALSDLQDLQKHLQYVLQRLGLRIYLEEKLITNKKTDLTNMLKYFDNIGIPFTLIIEENTLRNGLLKLRNRDTTLEETIHISDITYYLPKLY